MNRPQKTENGLMRIAFADTEEAPCFAQDSSMASPASMWLGREGEGMHLDADAAKDVATILDRFVGTGSVADEPRRGRRTILAGLLRLHDLVQDEGPQASSIRYALRCAMNSSAGLRREAPGLATWGEPSKRRTVWMLRFEDTEVGDMIFDSAVFGELDAEQLAREAYEKHIQNWNCTLFQTAPATSRAETEARTADLLRGTAERMSELHQYGVAPRVGTLLEAAGDVVDGDGRTAPMIMAWRASLRRSVRQLEADLESKRDTVSLYERLLTREQNDEERLDTKRNLEERRSDEAAIRADLDKARSALAGSDVDPLSHFLPIGTEVSVHAVDVRSINPIPVAGSRGVVVGYSVRGDRCNVIAFPQETNDVLGGVYSFVDEDDDPEDREYRPVKFLYRRDELDVVRHGVLVGGGENLRPGYHPTHRHDDDPDDDDMLVESCGFTWRTQMINEVPENTQIHPQSSYFLDWMRPIGEPK
jgi:hypothetical protein